MPHVTDADIKNLAQTMAHEASVDAAHDKAQVELMRENSHLIERAEALSGKVMNNDDAIAFLTQLAKRGDAEAGAVVVDQQQAMRRAASTRSKAIAFLTERAESGDEDAKALLDAINDPFLGSLGSE
jgi:hypothetical protein